MRRSLLFPLLVFLCVLCHNAGAAPTTIRITLQLPPESQLFQNLKIFKDRVAEQSRGDLIIQLFPSSELYQAHEVPNAVGSGQIEMGAALLSQYVESVPATDIFAVPFLFREPAIFEAATRSGSGVRAPIDEAVRNATGARVLWWVPNGAEAMGTKGGPLSSPAGIAGKKIRVAGATLAEFIKNCGGIAIVTPGSEQYGVFQRGEVNGVSTSIESFVSRRLWELADTITLLHHARQAFIVVINDKFWQSLSEDQRRILEFAAREAEEWAQKHDAAVDRQSIATLSQRGMKVAEVSGAELEEWKSCSSPVSEVFLEKSGPTGQRVMSAYRELLLDFVRNHPAVLQR
jgi:C4-dicarboxylate-binding protein DctP